MKLRCLIKLVHRQEIRFQQLKFFALNIEDLKTTRKGRSFKLVSNLSHITIKPRNVCRKVSSNLRSKIGKNCKNFNFNFSIVSIVIKLNFQDYVDKHNEKLNFISSNGPLRDHFYAAL